MTTDEGATRIRFPLLTARARNPPRRLDEGWPVSAISREDLQRHRSDNRPDDGLRPG